MFATLASGGAPARRPIVGIDTAFKDRAAVQAAAELFEQRSGGFSDGLVVAKHARQGCDISATFHRGLRKLPGLRIS